jgi:hypothetical protein
MGDWCRPEGTMAILGASNLVGFHEETNVGAKA